jgi:hypothetical protein
VTVVSLVDYTPPQRFDGTPWTVGRIEEAATADGTFSLIQSFNLSPIDSDPKNPLTRTFTTALATLDEGWYRIAWRDASSNQAVTPPVQNVDDSLPYEPAVNDVAQEWLRARTKDDNGVELGEFTADTRPTYEEALRVVKASARDLYTAIGSDVPDRLVESAKSTVALLAAMRIELSFFPDQIAVQRSPYRELKELFDASLKRLAAAVADASGTGDEFGASGMPAMSSGTCAPRTPSAEFPYGGGLLAILDDYWAAGWLRPGWQGP